MRVLMVVVVAVLAGCQSAPNPYPPGQGPGDGLIRAAQIMRQPTYQEPMRMECQQVFGRIQCRQQQY